MTTERRTINNEDLVFTYDETIYPTLDAAIADYTDGKDGKGYILKESYVAPIPVNLSTIDLTTLTLDQLKQLKAALNEIN